MLTGDTVQIITDAKTSTIYKMKRCEPFDYETVKVEQTCYVYVNQVRISSTALKVVCKVSNGWQQLKIQKE